jgi:PQQ system protein
MLNSPRFARDAGQGAKEDLHMRGHTRTLLLFATGVQSLTGCAHLGLLRPNTLKQLNPRVVRLVNELHRVDHPNEDIVGRLFAHGGLTTADVGDDGVMRARIRVPPNQFIWEPAIIVMPRAGELQLEFQNEDEVLHMAFLPSNGDRVLLHLPVESGGTARIHLDEPGLYWFGCPVANHAGRGMLGLVMVRGEVPQEARLDRPEQKRP